MKKEKKKEFGFKSKKKFFKNKLSKEFGFTNNPKYFTKNDIEKTSLDEKKKSFSFKGKKKFKNRSSRAKKFIFKKYRKRR